MWPKIAHNEPKLMLSTENRVEKATKIEKFHTELFLCEAVKAIEAACRATLFMTILIVTKHDNREKSACT